MTSTASTCSSVLQAAIAQLRTTDQRVRAHEQAHLAAAGQFAAGGATYQYQNGPDNQRYAVGGEVPIDASPVRGDPLATIQKMLTVMSAANAPADPSTQDRRVAGQAAMELSKAQADLAQKNYSMTEDAVEGDKLLDLLG